MVRCGIHGDALQCDNDHIECINSCAPLQLLFRYTTPRKRKTSTLATLQSPTMHLAVMTGLLVLILLPVCSSLHHRAAITAPTHPIDTLIKSNSTVEHRSPFADADFSDLLDATLLPDFWNTNDPLLFARIKTNGEPPEQLVKVTDRRHRFPVFATVCSLAFLVTIIAIIVVCTQ